MRRTSETSARAGRSPGAQRASASAGGGRQGIASVVPWPPGGRAGGHRELRNAISRWREAAPMSAARWLLAVAAVGLLTAPMVAPPFWITLLNYIGLYSIVALG